MKRHYYNHEVCQKCGGSCCSVLPGGCSPRDIKRMFSAIPLEEAIYRAITERKFCVSSRGWDDDGNLTYVRPRTVHYQDRRYDSSMAGGACIFWTSKGCELKPSWRPEECKRLEPRPNHEGCIMHFEGDSQQQICNLWAKTGINLLQWRGVIKKDPTTAACQNPSNR